MKSTNYFKYAKGELITTSFGQKKLSEIEDDVFYLEGEMHIKRILLEFEIIVKSYNGYIKRPVQRKKELKNTLNFFFLNRYDLSIIGLSYNPNSDRLFLYGHDASNNNYFTLCEIN